MNESIRMNILDCGWTGDYVVYTSKRVNTEEGMKDLEYVNHISFELVNTSNKQEVCFDAENGNGSAILVYFPIGDDEKYFSTLEMASKITVNVSDGWAVTARTDIDGVPICWEAVPSQTQASLFPKESVHISFDNVVTYKTPGFLSCLYVDVKNASIMEADCEVDKINEVEALPLLIHAPQLDIRKFTSDRSTVGILDRVNFSWEIEGGIDDNYLYPGNGINGEQEIYPMGSKECVVVESMNYAIAAKRKLNGWMYKFCPIYVGKPEILDFSCSLAGKSINYGTEITVSITLKNTYHCYLNYGIGAIYIEPQWVKGLPYIHCEYKLKPQHYKNKFVITCLGKERLIQKELNEIIVSDCLELRSCLFTRQSVDNQIIDDYDVTWDEVGVVTMQIVRLEDNKIVYKGNGTEKHCSFKKRHSMPCDSIRIECTGTNGQYIPKIVLCSNRD